MSSTQPRTQRKRAANAPLHTKRIMASSHLAPEIHDKSKAHLPRALPVRKGDTVRIMRGGFRGKEGKVVSVDRVHGTVVIEGITIEKVDEKKVARPLHASNLLIVRMDDTDPWRRRKFEEGVDREEASEAVAGSPQLDDSAKDGFLGREAVARAAPDGCERPHRPDPERHAEGVCDGTGGTTHPQRPRRPRRRPPHHGSEVSGRPDGCPLLRGDEGTLPNARQHTRQNGPGADRGGGRELEAVPRRGQDDGPPGQDAAESPRRTERAPREGRIQDRSDPEGPRPGPEGRRALRARQGSAGARDGRPTRRRDRARARGPAHPEPASEHRHIRRGLLDGRRQGVRSRQRGPVDLDARGVGALGGTMAGMRDIRIEKVVVNVGVGEGGEKLVKAQKVLELVTKQKSVQTLSHQAVRDLGVRGNIAIGPRVTLRGGPAEAFLTEALSIRNNRLPGYSFDSNGNFSFGIQDYTDFQGMKYDPEIGVFGMDVCVSLQRPGWRVARRSSKSRRIPRRHRVSRDEGVQFMKDRFNVEGVT